MKFKPGYLIDNVWKCTCTSLNAATLEQCPNCNMTKERFLELEKQKYIE